MINHSLIWTINLISHIFPLLLSTQLPIVQLCILSCLFDRLLLKPFVVNFHCSKRYTFSYFVQFKMSCNHSTILVHHPSSYLLHCGEGGFFLAYEVGEDLWWLNPRLQVFFQFFFFFFKVGNTSRTPISLFQAMVNPQWLSELRRPWSSVAWKDTCEFVSLKGSHTMPGEHTQPILTLFDQRCCVFRCYLPSALLAEWPGSFMCHCHDTGVERTLNKSQHRKLTLEKKILLPLLPGFKLATFKSWIWRSSKQAILTKQRPGGGFFLTCGDLGTMFHHSYLACAFFLFFLEENSSHTLIPFYMPGSIYSGSMSCDNCGRMFPDKLHLSSFPGKFPHYAWTAA